MMLFHPLPNLKNLIACLACLTLAAPSLAANKDALSIQFELGDSNGVYPDSEPIPVTVKIQGRTALSQQPNLILTMQTDNLFKPSTLQRFQQPIRENLVTPTRQSFSFQPPGPGFYRVTATLSQGSRKIQNSMLFGYSPEKIETPLTREFDFEAFWNDRRAELNSVKPQFKMTLDSERSTEAVKVYLVEMRSHGNVTIRGWYTTPKKPGRYPAILGVPGYNGRPKPYVNRKNVATLALHPRGHGMSKDEVDPKGGELMYVGFDPKRPEKYIYAGMYMDCVRAVDFLASRPEIDASRIGVEGGSQGGGLSFATAALDRRIMFCAAGIPWLCDWVGYYDTSEWPSENYPKLIAKHPGLTVKDINRVLSYTDTMNLADRISCPVFMGVGLQDDVCPPRTSFGTYNHVRSEKSYRVYPFTKHSSRPHYAARDEWIAEQLGLKNTGL